MKRGCPIGHPLCIIGGPVSRILYFRLVDWPPYEASIIYLLQPTPQQRTGSPWMLVYMALQVVVEYCMYVAAHTRELLPHVFTLTTVARGGYFLLPQTRTFARLRFPQCNALSCPDFPPNFLSDRTTCRGCKNSLLNLFEQIINME